MSATISRMPEKPRWIALSATSASLASTSLRTVVASSLWSEARVHAVVEDAHELPQQALVLDDADVALDVGVARDALGEEREISRAADRIELPAPDELLLTVMVSTPRPTAIRSMMQR